MAVTDNERPPYVAWEYRPVEDRAASIEKGHYATKDVAFAVITRPGSRDSLDKEAETWLAELSMRARKNEFRSDWLQALQQSYQFWKTGEEAPVSGTPIRGWQVLSPSAQKELIGLGIRTVEDLAALPDSELNPIGTGAVSYKQKARAWLDAASGNGKIAEQMADLSQKLTALTELTRKQAEEIDRLRAMVPQEKANPLAVKG
jgi:hypothetical protein